MLNQNESRDVGAKAIEIKAKTVDEAIELGLAQLGLTRDQVDIEVVNEGKRGVFGLGFEEANVRLRPKGQAIVETSERTDEAGANAPLASDETLVSAEATSTVVSAPSQPETGLKQEESLEEIAVHYLEGLLQRMGVEAKVTPRLASDLVEPGEEPPLVLDVTGKDLGILIGRRSETLQALQYMVRLMVSRHLTRWQPVVVDVESYRARRQRSLRQMAQKMAERAATSGRRVVLEAMPAYERRIIHLTLKNHPAVFTKSIGSDDHRKVTIIPK